MTNLTASSYAVLLPVFAKDVFGGDAQTLGWLWGAAGCGAFLASVFLAARRALAGLVGAVQAGSLLSGAALLAFAAGFAVRPFGRNCVLVLWPSTGCSDQSGTAA